MSTRNPNHLEDVYPAWLLPESTYIASNYIAGLRVVFPEEDALSEEVARAKRVMAQRARRLAKELALEADRSRLLKHAEELEAQADEIERRTPEHGQHH